MKERQSLFQMQGLPAFRQAVQRARRTHEGGDREGALEHGQGGRDSGDHGGRQSTDDGEKTSNVNDGRGGADKSIEQNNRVDSTSDTKMSGEVCILGKGVLEREKVIQQKISEVYKLLLEHHRECHTQPGPEAVGADTVSRGESASVSIGVNDNEDLSTSDR